MARIGMFGIPYRRDYVSRLPIWHSCFILRQMLEPSILLGEDSPMEKTIQTYENDLSKLFGFAVHATGSMAEGLFIHWKTNKPTFLSDMDEMLEYKNSIAGYDPETSDLILQDSENDVHPGFALLKKRNTTGCKTDDCYFCNGIPGTKS